MHALTGTEKEVAYAESLRTKEITKLEAGLSKWEERAAGGSGFAQKQLARNRAAIERLTTATTAREVLDELAG